MNAESSPGDPQRKAPSTGFPSTEPATPDTEADADAERRGSVPRRLRKAIEGTWEEASKLSETVLDAVIVPPSGFAASAVAWLTSLFFFAVSLVVGVVLGLAGLVLFIGLECLAFIAYAYPGTLFLLSVAGGVAPPLILYWAIHMLVGIEGPWSTWAFWPLLLGGAWGSYYYWRFARVIATTGEGALAFYRGVAPKAGEIFGAPFAVFSGVWDVLKLFVSLFRSVGREFFKLLSGWSDRSKRSRESASPPSPPTNGPSPSPSSSD
jgi:hypothetical protein